MALRVAVLDGRLHDRAAFSCGIAALDDYLRTRASQHARDGIATTHVLTDDAAPASILGYCTLSAAQLLLHELAEADRARLPTHPVPAMRMGRLAVATAEQGQGHGQQHDEDGGRQVGPPDHKGAPEDAVTVPHLRFRVPGDFHDPRDRIGALVGAHVGHPFSVVTGALTVSRRSVGSPSPTPMGGVSGLWPAA